MKIPKYVIELMKRSYYYYNSVDNEDDYAVGYTIAIKKSTPYAYARTLKAEIKRLQAWVNRQRGGDCRILYLPQKTHYSDQVAIVTIFDPVMIHLEKYIHP